MTDLEFFTSSSVARADFILYNGTLLSEKQQQIKDKKRIATFMVELNF